MHRRHVSASLARLELRYTDASSATGMLQTNVAAVRVAMLLDLVSAMPSAVPLSSASSAAAAVGDEPASSITAAPVQDADTDKLCNGDSKSPARPASCCGGGGGGGGPSRTHAALTNSDLEVRIAETRRSIAAFEMQEKNLQGKLHELFSRADLSSEDAAVAAEAASTELLSQLDDTSSNLRFLREALTKLEQDWAATAAVGSLRAEFEQISAVVEDQRRFRV